MRQTFNYRRFVRTNNPVYPENMSNLYLLKTPHLSECIPTKFLFCFESEDLMWDSQNKFLNRVSHSVPRLETSIKVIKMIN
jgi:hypothetical protein